MLGRVYMKKLTNECKAYIDKNKQNQTYAELAESINKEFKIAVSQYTIGHYFREKNKKKSVALKTTKKQKSPTVVVEKSEPQEKSLISAIKELTAEVQTIKKSLSFFEKKIEKVVDRTEYMEEFRSIAKAFSSVTDKANFFTTIMGLDIQRKLMEGSLSGIQKQIFNDDVNPDSERIPHLTHHSNNYNSNSNRNNYGNRANRGNRNYK